MVEKSTAALRIRGDHYIMQVIIDYLGKMMTLNTVINKTIKFKIKSKC